MSVNNVSQAAGFDPNLYNNLLEQAQAKKIDAGTVDELLLAAINKGQSFNDAIKSVKGDLPTLSAPNGKAFANLKDWVTLPAPGALIMSVIVENLSEQRKMHKESAWAETEAIAQSMHNEADEMREAAQKQFVMACVSGGLQIAAGAVQVAGGAFSLGKIASIESAVGKTGEAATKATEAANKTMAQVKAVGETAGGISGIIGGAGKFTDAAGQRIAAMAQARCKEMQADQEKLRAVRDSTKELDQALKETNQKVLNAMNGIAENFNQTRARILA